MRFTVIGNYGGFPEAGGATSGYLVEKDGFSLLVDCGSAVVSNLQRYIKIEKLDAVLVSHYHFDHIADIGILQYARLIKSKLGIESPTLEVYGHPFDEGEFRKLSMEPYTKGIPYAPLQRLEIGPFIVTFCPTVHPVKCFAVRITDGSHSIVYTGDTSYFKDLSDFSAGCDLLVCECNLYKNQDGSPMGHMNSIDAGVTARDAGAKKLLLTHLPHNGNLEDLLEEAGSVYKGSIELAQPGWEMRFA